jgi:hypothetical protein
MARNGTHHRSDVHTVSAEHRYGRALRLLVLVSTVVLWRVAAAPSSTCAGNAPTTSPATPAFAYFFVASTTLGTVAAVAAVAPRTCRTSSR